MHILLAEDDIHVAAITRMALEKLGHHTVVVAKDGEEAVLKALSEKFDLLILDGMMPKMNGVHCARTIKNQSKGFVPPIIFLSAKSQRTDIEEFLQNGDGFIQKPYNPREICASIDKILADIQRRAA